MFVISQGVSARGRNSLRVRGVCKVLKTSCLKVGNASLGNLMQGLQMNSTFFLLYPCIMWRNAIISILEGFCRCTSCRAVRAESSNAFLAVVVDFHGSINSRLIKCGAEHVPKRVLAHGVFLLAKV